MGLNASAFFKGYGFMENVQDKAYQRERQEKQDAIEAEKMARTRKDWEYQDKHNADIDQELANAKAFVGQDYAPVADKLGLNAPDSVAGLRDWSRRDALPREDMGPVAPAAVAQTGLAPQKFTSDQANNLAALNLAGRNPKAIFDVRQAHTNSILASQANELKDRVLKADDEQLKELVGKWTLDKRQKFEVDYDPKTGLSRVAHGKDAVELNRSDLANFVAARYRQSQGDPTAGAEIDAIDGKLTKMVQDSLTQSKALADSGNDAAFKAHGMAKDEERLKLERERLGLTRAEIGSRAAKPNYIQLVDAKGEAQMVNANALPEKDGVLTLPQGLRYPRQKPQLDPVAHAQAVKYYTESGMPAKAAMMQADQMFGVAPPMNDIGAQLQKLNASKGGSEAAPRAEQTPNAPSLQPKSPAEFRVLNSALQRGLVPVGRGNSAFGEGELLFEDKQGTRMWASQLN